MYKYSLAVLVVLLSMGCTDSKDGNLKSNIPKGRNKTLAPAAANVEVVEQKPAVSKTGYSKDLQGNGVLGRGFNLTDDGVRVGSSKGQFINSDCVTGEVVSVNTSTGFVLGFDYIGEKDRSELLGFNLDSRKQEDATIESNFAALSKSSDLSSSAVYYVTDYKFNSQTLRNYKYNELGESLRNDPATLKSICGEKFVVSTAEIARFFALMRIDFTSAEQKESFEKAVPNYSLDMLSFIKRIKEASNLDGKIKLTFSAYQIGGDTSKLAEVFGGSKNNSESCELGNLPACETIVDKIAKYAFDTKVGFPSQIAPGVLPGPVTVPTKVDLPYGL